MKNDSFSYMSDRKGCALMSEKLNEDVRVSFDVKL